MKKHIRKTVAILLLIAIAVSTMMSGASATQAHDEALSEIVHEDHSECLNVTCVEPSIVLVGANHMVVLTGDDLTYEMFEYLGALSVIPFIPHCPGAIMTNVNQTATWSIANATWHRLDVVTTWQCSICRGFMDTFSSGPLEAHVYTVSSHWHGSGTTHHATQICIFCAFTRQITWSCPGGGNCISPAPSLFVVEVQCADYYEFDVRKPDILIGFFREAYELSGQR